MATTEMNYGKSGILPEIETVFNYDRRIVNAFEGVIPGLVEDNLISITTWVPYVKEFDASTINTNTIQLPGDNSLWYDERNKKLTI
jgi:hypothetical protein